MTERRALVKRLQSLIKFYVCESNLCMQVVKNKKVCVLKREHVYVKQLGKCAILEIVVAKWHQHSDNITPNY